MPWIVLGNRHDAEDAAQDAFVVAFHKLPGLRGRSKYGHWLLKITRRQALRCAKRRRQPLPLDRAVEEWPPRRTVPAPQSGGPEPADAGETRGNTSLLQWSFCPTDRRSDRAPARYRHQAAFTSLYAVACDAQGARRCMMIRHFSSASSNSVAVSAPQRRWWTT